MPICSLCESSQPAGDACGTCGRPFAPGASAPEGLVAPLEVDRGRHLAAAAPLERLAELEPTAASGAPAAASAEALDGLERTAHAAGPPVAPEPLDLEPARAAAVPDDRGARGPVVCRYCGTPPAVGEVLCARCGMRLPRLRPRAPAAVAPPPRCSGCGVPLAGPRCPACGSRRGG
jgi:hypothetical protein